MNCQGIARVLDDARIDALSAAELDEIEGHLASCADCAGDWEVDARVRAAKIPRVSQHLLRWHPGRPSANALSEAGPRRRGHLVVIPLLLLAGAAAAFMLGSLLEAPQSTGAVSTVVDRSADSATRAAEGAASDVEAPAPAAALDADPADPGGLQRHRLIIVGPVHAVETTEAVHTAESIHRGVVRFFASRPEFEVVEITAARLAALLTELAIENPSNPMNVDRAVMNRLDSRFSVRVQSQYSRAPDLWTIDVIHSYETADGRAGGGSVRGRRGADPEAAGANLALHVYANFFPEPGIDEILALAADSNRTAEDRIAALQEAVMVAVPLRGSNTLADAARSAFDGAIELARTAADASFRRQAWDWLAQTRHPSVAQPLSDTLLYDVDADVRAAAAERLYYYVEDPVVRAALDTAANTDRSPDVRLRARWSTLTNEDRAALVRTTLLDAGLSPEERVAPLTYARSNRNASAGSQRSAIPALDGEALDALAALLASSDDRDVRRTVLTELGLAGHPEFLASFKAEQDNGVRETVVNGLTNRIDQPGVRASLEQIRDELEPRSVSWYILDSALRRLPGGGSPGQ